MRAALELPPRLRRGDTVGVVAPASAVLGEDLRRGVAALAAMGYRVKVSAHALDRAGILAGPDQVRADELQAFFADPEVKAVFGARGGYGSGRLLPLLDFAAIARQPKIFLGFSDATYLLNALLERSSLVCFHGPMVAMDFARGLPPAAAGHLQRLLSGELPEFTLEATATLRPGLATGPIVGGCLSVVAAMLATPWAPSFDQRILFLEDTGEKAYRIDRMLVHLRQAGVFERVAGVVFGAIQPVGGGDQERIRIKDFAAEQTAEVAGPVLYGIAAGHGSTNFTLPLGLRTTLDGARRLVTFNGPAVR